MSTTKSNSKPHKEKRSCNRMASSPSYDAYMQFMEVIQDINNEDYERIVNRPVEKQLTLPF